MTLAGQDIVCFALRRWDGLRKNNQQVMRLLALQNRVLYVNPPSTLREALGRRAGRLMACTVRAETEGCLYVLQDPRLLPRWRRGHLVAVTVNAVTGPLRLTAVRRVAARLGFRSPILWIYDPLAAPAVGTFSERLVVYFVIDQYAEYYAHTEARWRATMIAHHRSMLARADVVFAVSESLQRQCCEVNQNSYLIPNAVDFETFQARCGVEPADAADIPRPVIGYVGVIHSIVDLPLLELVARARPSWSLMLVGPAEDLLEDDRRRFQRLVALPNVHYLGFKQPEEVPGYVGRCDVTLLPYRIGPLTQHIDSLKLYEYLACGKPVVSTDLPAARRFDGLVSIAYDPAGFLQAIENALSEHPGQAQTRIQAARGHSWTNRVEAMGAILASRLEGRSSSA